MSGLSKAAAQLRVVHAGTMRPMPPVFQRDDAGRTRLIVLERDPHGRGERVSLARPLFNDGWQNEVAVGAASTAHATLGDAPTLAKAVALARNAMAATSKIAEGALAQAPERPPACRAGCAHCCHQAVGVVAPEVLAIHDHLRKTRTRDGLAAVADRVRRADDRTRGLPAAERLSPELPCPFLEDDGQCGIYPARPLACRGANSLDAATCERTLHDPEARAQLLAGALPIPCYLEPIRAAHAVTAGLQLGLGELHAFAMVPLELTAAMRILVDDPDAVSRAWLAGEDPFAAARGADVTDDPRSFELSGRAR
jgi:hypothetical protein